MFLYIWLNKSISIEQTMGETTIRLGYFLITPPSKIVYPYKNKFATMVFAISTTIFSFVTTILAFSTTISTFITYLL